MLQFNKETWQKKTPAMSMYSFRNSESEFGDLKFGEMEMSGTPVPYYAAAAAVADVCDDGYRHWSSSSSSFVRQETKIETVMILFFSTHRLRITVVH